MDTGMIVVNREALEDLIRRWRSAEARVIEEYSDDTKADFRELADDEQQMRAQLIIGRALPGSMAGELLFVEM